MTPLERQHKKQRDDLKLLHNAVLSRFALKQITNWNQVYIQLGIDGTRDEPVVYKELVSFLDNRKKELEERIKSDTSQQSRTQSDNSRTENLPISGTFDTRKAESIATRNEQSLQVEQFLPTPAPNAKSGAPLLTPPLVETATKVLFSEQHDTEVDDDYGWVRSPNVSKDYFPYYFQKKASKQIQDKFWKENKRAVLLIATTGAGKTFIAGDVLRYSIDNAFEEGKTWSHVPYLEITRATVVEQTERVNNKKFNITVDNTEVINIEQLRSKAGRLWVKERMEIVNGEEQWFWEWKPKINPYMVLLDECQAVKNEGSTQHQIMLAYSRLTSDTKQLYISATPFTRVIEAKCFAIATRMPISQIIGVPGAILNEETWPTFADVVCGKASKPDEYNEAACERLMKYLDPYVVRVKGIKFQFEADNKTEKINFETKEESDYYHSAWDRYLKELAKLEARAMAEGKSGGKGGVNKLVAFLKFRMAAEYCRRYVIARKMYQSVQSGKAAVAALNFKSTIIAVTQILVNDFNVPRDKISLVWGGGQTALTDKQKAKANVRKKAKLLESMGITEEEMIEDLGLEDVEDRIVEELDPSLRLGAQSREERQTEIDKFQSGKSLYCMFTFRAGGVGLSLHHSDEMTTDWDRDVEGFSEWFKMIQSLPESKRPLPGKVRRKKSGYAFEEDVKFIPVRPRECFLAPTYSAIELVQGLGRCPRLTSLSVTKQTLLFYRGTIEDDVAAIVQKKLRCLGKVVRMREQWHDVAAIPAGQRSQYTEEVINSVSEDADGNVNASEIDTNPEEE